MPRAIRMGEALVTEASESPGGLEIVGLGSCVALYMHDPRSRCGGLAHILLPGAIVAGDQRAEAATPGGALETLLAGLRRYGVRREDLVVKLAGGSRMFSGACRKRPGPGERNVQAMLEALADCSLQPAAMDIGGASGRTLRADLTDGSLTITSLRGDCVRL
jgi:chemotaxis protein CheD